MEFGRLTVPAMLQLETKSTSAITALAFSPDGMRLLVGYAKGGVQEWDAFGCLLVSAEGEVAQECFSVAWSPSGDSWVCGMGLHYERWKDGQQILGHGFGDMYSPIMAFLYLSERLAVVGQGHPTLVGSGALRLHYFSEPESNREPEPIYESSGVRGVAVHRESRLVAWITGHSQLKLWRTDRPDKYAIPLKKTAKCLALSPDGKTIAVAVEWAILTFSTGTRFPLQELKGHKGKVTSLSFSPDGSRIVSGSWDETIREWDATTGKELRSMNWKIGQIAALSCAPDGTRIAAGSTSGRVMIWDVD